MYDCLERYARNNLVKEFSFNIPLNPRNGESEENTFINFILENFSYDIGDRARCFYKLNEKYCSATCLHLVQTFDSKLDEINMYKSIPSLCHVYIKINRM